MKKVNHGTMHDHCTKDTFKSAINYTTELFLGTANRPNNMNWAASFPATAPYYLCYEGLGDYFEIPRHVTRIACVISDTRPSDDSDWYRLTPRTLSGFLGNTNSYVKVGDRIVAVTRDFWLDCHAVNAGRPVYVWIEY